MIKKLLQRIYELKNRQGKMPTGIYLGYNNKMELFSSPEAKYYFSACPTGERLKLNDVPIYFVDADDHVNVG